MDPIIGAGLGMVLGQYNDNRQIDQQKRLQSMQIEGQKEMANYSQKQQKEMWDYTNYENQKKHMKNAGLNPALMYGMGGGGGTSVGSGASSSIGSGSAPVGGQEVKQSMEIAMQMKAQTELLQAQKDSILIDNKKKTTEIPKIEEDTTGKKLENKWEMFLQSQQKNSDGTDGQSLKEKGLRYEQNKTLAQIMNLEKQRSQMDTGIENTKQETANKKQAFDMLEKMNPMELQKFEKELELLLNNPMNSNMGQWGKVLLDIIKVLK